MINGEALAVSSILQMAENRANGHPGPGHSSSSREQYRALHVATLVLLIVIADAVFSVLYYVLMK